MRPPDLELSCLQISKLNNLFFLKYPPWVFCHNNRKLIKTLLILPGGRLPAHRKIWLDKEW